jgi:DNA-binding phage protein
MSRPQEHQRNAARAMIARGQLSSYAHDVAKLLDAIRREIERSGLTRYRIAKESGVSAGQLSRLVNNERGMTLDTVERLVDYLGLEVVIRPKTRRRRK